MTDKNKIVDETTVEELKLRQNFDYKTAWRLVGKFERYGFVHYEEQWVNDQSVIEATVAVWKREGATEIVQYEYLFKNGKILYMVACV